LASPFLGAASFFSGAAASTKLAVLTKQQYLEWNSLTGANFCSSLKADIASLASELEGKIKTLTH
jgi:hypothetical protein